MFTEKKKKIEIYANGQTNYMGKRTKLKESGQRYAIYLIAIHKLKGNYRLIMMHVQSSSHGNGNTSIQTTLVSHLLPDRYQGILNVLTDFSGAYQVYFNSSI